MKFADTTRYVSWHFSLTEREAADAISRGRTFTTRKGERLGDARAVIDAKQRDGEVISWP